MSYLSLDEYQRKWIFTHQSMPVPEEELEQIKPMTQARSAQLWKENISAQSPDAERLSSQDWPMKTSNWLHEVDWMQDWDSEIEDLPAEILEHVDWQDDVTVYFCYEKYNIIETKWAFFKKYWKNFLFYDDGPILIGRRRNEALWFSDSGTVKVGYRNKS
ncbi:hypothetical protein VINI7043_12091 [Vibrio nigripulchritudo ATCC 27043]|uniref:DUF2947 domain-containing protein n=1 Tax=Vibrio nigripulchritudo TaxID=28173 RepID=U4KCC3_9VIBR|nr:DUF2947 domain-containing protein [Vibrio nigripulchritudo]EGU54750.1 hypothetical protein VINI7043_12091 [Vibrio nigripulchritudo ATCC 27043]CCN37277.1 conserved hypothetical protein [Vibrio nigripulchritudo AM115]CCN41399.1 conserved hypothetical protein [Vibrio nigripulchritudo FTn2]CCN64762.1 conserved hypothetical protein [Vibrio nigripulchritudo POn4]CCN76864.1 conserved hypothetical protein [Vibrio nigripulchritudo SO65]